MAGVRTMSPSPNRLTCPTFRGLECHLAATDVSEVGIVAEISALITGVEFGHGNVSLLLTQRARQDLNLRPTD